MWVKFLGFPLSTEGLMLRSCKSKEHQNTRQEFPHKGWRKCFPWVTGPQEMEPLTRVAFKVFPDKGLNSLCLCVLSISYHPISSGASCCRKGWGCYALRHQQKPLILVNNIVAVVVRSCRDSSSLHTDRWCGLLCKYCCPSCLAPWSNLLW